MFLQFIYNGFFIIVFIMFSYMTIEFKVFGNNFRFTKKKKKKINNCT